MHRHLSAFLSASLLLLLHSTNLCAFSMLAEDTMKKFLVTDTTWFMSSEIDFYSCNSFPWPGTDSLPADSTFTIPVTAGQPYSFPTIGTLPDAVVLKSEQGVRFFRTTFLLDSAGVLTQCRLRAFMDDDLEVYINGTLIALEGSGSPSNYNGVPHDLVVYNFGPNANGFNGGQTFDFSTTSSANMLMQPGENEIILALRNRQEDIGGLTFRMDYSYVIAPDWVGIGEPNRANSNLEIYPNPTMGNVKLHKGVETENITLKLFGTDGRQIFEKEWPGREQVEIDIANRPAGIYLLQWVDKKGIHSQRIIKK